MYIIIDIWCVTSSVLIIIIIVINLKFQKIQQIPNKSRSSSCFLFHVSSPLFNRGCQGLWEIPIPGVPWFMRHVVTVKRHRTVLDHITTNFNIFLTLLLVLLTKTPIFHHITPYTSSQITSSVQNSSLQNTFNHIKLLIDSSTVKLLLWNNLPTHLHTYSATLSSQTSPFLSLSAQFNKHLKTHFFLHSYPS